jgi:UrcA family protein
MKSHSSILVLSIALLFGATPLLTRADELPQRTVRFTASDAETEAGISALYTRIRRASGEVCESLDTHTPGSMAIAHRCQADATARAVASLDLPTLMRYHLAQSGQPTLVVRR